MERSQQNLEIGRAIFAPGDARLLAANVRCADILVHQGRTAEVIRNVSTVGGILPHSPIAQQSNKLTNQVVAVNQSVSLVNLDRVLGRMQTNIGTIKN